MCTLWSCDNCCCVKALSLILVLQPCLPPAVNEERALKGTDCGEVTAVIDESQRWTTSEVKILEFPLQGLTRMLFGEVNGSPA